MSTSLPSTLAMPFLTLTAHPAIGAVLLDPRPAWVWNEEGNRILWSNRAGIDFFSVKSMHQLLDRKFGDVHPARRHLARLARNARADAPILDRLRFFLGDTTVTTSCLCKRLQVEGETVLLVIATETDSRNLQHEQQAQELLDALVADGEIAAAFVNPEGRPWVSAGEEAEPLCAHWQALFRDQGRLHVMIAESNTPLRLAACTILADETRDAQGERDRSYASEKPEPLAALVRIGEEQDRHYLVLLHRPDTIDEQMAENLHLLTTDLDGDPFSDPEEMSDKEATTLFPDIFNADTRHEDRSGDLDLHRDSDVQPYLFEDHSAGFSDAAAPASAQPSAGLGKIVSIATGRETEESALPPAPEHETSEESDETESQFRFDRNAGPFHFIWESDEVGRFSLVSDDLAKAVGPGNAQLVGKDWPEISNWLHMDGDQKIARAFESRDTWAGHVVHWPVEGQELTIPVELTGLPVFGRFHGFQGFRGFGVCHVNRAETPKNDPEIDGIGQNSHSENTRTPQLDARSELMSDELLLAARTAVATTEAVISPALGDGVDDGHAPEDEVTRVSEKLNDPAEETKKGEETTNDHGTEDHDTPAAERSSLPRNPYDLVTSLLQPPEPGSEDNSVETPSTPETPVPSSDEDGVADVFHPSLSLGERSAFDTIAAALKDSSRPRLDDHDDMDDDYEELEHFDRADEDDEEDEADLTAVTALSEEAASLMQDQDVAQDNAPVTAMDLPPEASEQIAEEMADTPESPKAAEPVAEPVQQSRKRDTVLRSATHAAFAEIMALDPAFRSLRERAAQPAEDVTETISETAPQEPVQQDDTPEAIDPASEDDQTVEPIESEAVEGSEIEGLEVEGPESEVDEANTSAITDDTDDATVDADEEPSEPEIALEAEAEEDTPENSDAADTPDDADNTAIAEATEATEDNADDRQDQAPSGLEQESSMALAAATVAGVAALGSSSLWDRKADNSPLIDLLNKIPTAILVSANSEILFASRKALRALGYETAASLEEAGGMEGLFTGRPGDWLTKTDGRTTLRGADHVHRSVLACISSINWGEKPAAMLTFEPAPDTPPGTGVSEEDEKIAELEAILDTATDGVVVMDETGHILRMNHSAEALFEVDRHEVAGSSFLDMIMEESHKDVLDYLERLKKNGFASLLNDGRDIIGRVPSGGMLPLFMTMGRVAIPGTNRFCAVLRDVTEWKRTEETMLSDKLRAESASKQKSEFLTRVSHEIRTPLNAILGFSEVMMEEQFGPIGSQRYKDYLKDISVSGNHIMALLNDIMDLSKVESGKLDLNFEATPLNRLVAEGVGIMQPQANREQIIIRTSLASSLPDIAGDDRSLRQVVLNLLSNALKFTPAGGQVIVSTLQEESGDVVLRIRDTGIGMSEDDIQSALEPFRQLASNRKDDGIGLGLPLTKALVEANRGRLRLSSKEKHGTLVEVAFPKKRVIETEDKTEEAETLV